MKKIFYEIVIEGQLPIIKGFVYGVKEGSKRSEPVIFSHENNIKTETFGEALMEWIHLRESLCHLVIEKRLLEAVKKGVENTSVALDLRIKEVKEINKASFHFQYEVYARKYGEEIKNIFKELPSALTLSSDYQPQEKIHPECKGVETFAPFHDYTLKAQGTVEGPIDALLLFYKKIQEKELIKEDQIILHFKNAA